MQVAARSERRVSPAARRAGYVVAAAVNAALLVIVNHLLEWGWLPFLTEDFTGILPVLNLSLIATIVVNLGYLVVDPPPVVAAGSMLLNVISLVVAVRFWQVFPFDFGDDGQLWTRLARLALAVGVIGTAVAAVVDVVRLARTASPVAPGT
jgi:hypothetical protein